jgi:hypothetical protein
MNIHKRRGIIDFVRKQGKLPTDQFGQILPVKDLVSWFELDKYLSASEQEVIKGELAALVEVEEAMEKLKLLKQAQTNTSS